LEKNLLIVFVKNIKLGKVKTRLAKTISNDAAFEVYKELVKIIKKTTENLPVTTHVYFSDEIVHNKWNGHYKTVQTGNNLGERMQNAFQEGFDKGFEHIILVGSDIPDLTSEIIMDGFSALQNNDTVFGKALDGGYYLVGLSNMNAAIFENKPWSTPQLLDVTLQQLSKENKKVSLLQTLNDIDTYEDLIASNFYKNNKEIQKIVRLQVQN